MRPFAIVSTIGGLTEIVEHGRNGLHVTPGDVDGLDAAMTTMLENEEEAAAMGLRARKSFDEKFSTAAILPATEMIYAQAIARREALAGSHTGRKVHV